MTYIKHKEFEIFFDTYDKYSMFLKMIDRARFIGALRRYNIFYDMTDGEECLKIPSQKELNDAIRIIDCASAIIEKNIGHVSSFDVDIVKKSFEFIYFVKENDSHNMLQVIDYMLEILDKIEQVLEAREETSIQLFN